MPSQDPSSTEQENNNQISEDEASTEDSTEIQIPPPNDIPNPLDLNTDSEVKDRLYYRIGEISKMLHVEKHVIRYWEKEFEINTHRSSSGQRLYRTTEMNTFRKIKSLIYDEGYTIQGAKKFLTPQEESTKTHPKSNHDQISNIRQVFREIKQELQDIQEILRTLSF